MCGNDILAFIARRESVNGYPARMTCCIATHMIERTKVYSLIRDWERILNGRISSYHTRKSAYSPSDHSLECRSIQFPFDHSSHDSFFHKPSPITYMVSASKERLRPSSHSTVHPPLFWKFVCSAPYSLFCPTTPSETATSQDLCLSGQPLGAVSTASSFACEHCTIGHIVAWTCGKRPA